MNLFPADRLKQRAIELGFNLVGLTHAQPSPRLNDYLRWIEAGYQGGMGYMARPDRVTRRRDLNIILDGAASLVMVGLDYHALNIPPEILNDPARGRFAAYAWGADYHEVLTPRLEALADWLRAESGIAFTHRAYVDTGAVLERSHAQQAGMGFIGKNTMLIHPRRGSTFFLGELITTLEFDTYDSPLPQETMCGRCTRCLSACPTDAFPRPHVLDASRCISYLTIEHKGSIPLELRARMGNWVYGCDVCQEVCPWQRFALPASENSFYPAALDTVAPPLLDLLMMDQTQFSARYGHTAAARIKRERLVRNACVAAGNWGSARALPALNALLTDPSPLIRAHAAWAVYNITTDAAYLKHLLDSEQDAAVRAELEKLLP